MSDKSLIEAALFVAGKSVSIKELEKITGLEKRAVESIIEQLVQEYSQRDSGVLIERSEEGFAMRVKPEFEEKIIPLIPETDLPKSMLKTLALIAHEQPIKQTAVVKMRGNRVYDYIHRLIELDLLDAKPEGRTKILTTTDKFKEYFKLSNAQQEIIKTQGPKQTTLELPEENAETKETTENN